MTRLRSPHTLLYHFTHVSHLTDIVRDGLLSDVGMRATGRGLVEAGDPQIKETRRSREVPSGPGGVVGDYTPFYFAGRSPMLFKVSRGGVPGFTGTVDKLVYLITSIEVLRERGLQFVITDRNAATATASFHGDGGGRPEQIDWDLMDAHIWRSTPEEPDRMERRMAECLVHRVVPWSAFLGLAVASTGMAERVRDVLKMSGVDGKVRIEPGLYY